MSNKTPPLVIPVVVDATGVSKGLNNVNDRLRRGVSNGGSGDGSFGSGGGMGATTAVLAAGGIAGGAAAFARGRRFGSHEPGTRAWERALDSEARSTRVGRALNNVSRLAYNRASRIEELAAEKSKNDIINVPRANRLYAASKAAAWSGVYASRGIRAASSLSGPLGSAIYPIAGLAGAAAGLGSAAMNFSQNFKSNASNMQNLVGNPMYGKLRPFQLRQNMAMGTPTNTQSFMAGSLMMTGGKQTRAERNTNSVNSGVSGMMQMVGGAYENPQAAWLGIKAALGFQVTGNQMIQSVINRSSN